MKFELSGERDSDLQAILKEINEILKKNDLGGVINLVSKTHSEFGISFPPWSGLAIETAPDGGFGIRLKMQADQIERANLTAQFLMSNRNAAGLLYTTMEELLQDVEKLGAQVTVITPGKPSIH